MTYIESDRSLTIVVSIKVLDAVKKDKEFQVSLRDICDDAGCLLTSAKEKGQSLKGYRYEFMALKRTQFKSL